MSGDVFISIFSTDDSGRENGVCWRETRGDGKRRQKIEPWDQGVDETGRDEPTLERHVKQKK